MERGVCTGDKQSIILTLWWRNASIDLVNFYIGVGIMPMPECLYHP